MAYAKLHNDDRPAMAENSFTCIVLTNRQTEDTGHGTSNSDDVSKAAASLPQAGGKAMACEFVSHGVWLTWYKALGIASSGSSSQGWTTDAFSSCISKSCLVLLNACKHNTHG